MYLNTPAKYKIFKAFNTSMQSTSKYLDMYLSTWERSYFVALFMLPMFEQCRSGDISLNYICIAGCEELLSTGPNTRSEPQSTM